MSLDVDLMVTQPTSVYSANITHNLCNMASEVYLGGGVTLYQVLWRPDEHGMKFARDISDYLTIGLDVLKTNPEKYKKFNPENGWGSYEGLCEFVYKYRNACWDNPDAELSVCR